MRINFVEYRLHLSMSASILMQKWSFSVKLEKKSETVSQKCATVSHFF